MTIKKFCIATLFLSIFIPKISAQKTTYQDDPSAFYLLEKMNLTMQSLESCSFTAHISYDISNDDLGMVKHSCEEKVWMKFPGKFLITSEGDKGDNTLICNGTDFYYYSFLKNCYAKTKAEKRIVETMHKVHSEFGIDFPAADFFYPTFVDDIKAVSSTVLNLGLANVFGTWCFHIAGKDADGTGFQFWISKDPLCLPIKMVITYPQQNHSLQYEAYYTDWNVSETFPDVLFEFLTPPRAEKIEFMPNNDKNP